MPAAVTKICIHACKHSEIRWEKICAAEQNRTVWSVERGRAGGGAAEERLDQKRSVVVKRP